MVNPWSDESNADKSSTDQGDWREADSSPKSSPLQFSIRSMLGLMTAVAALFGTLRWLGISAGASAMVLLILAVAVAASLGLLLAIARAADSL